MYNNKLALVHISALPEVFGKVLDAKKLLASGEAKNASDAVLKCGISRSAFYKYKDSIFTYNEQQVFNIKAELKDEAGILSEFLSVIYKYRANVLTVNQGIPSNHVATVSVSLRTDSEHVNIDDMLNDLRNLRGVVSAEQII